MSKISKKIIGVLMAAIFAIGSVLLSPVIVEASQLNVAAFVFEWSGSRFESPNFIGNTEYFFVPGISDFFLWNQYEDYEIRGAVVDEGKVAIAVYLFDSEDAVWGGRIIPPETIGDYRIIGFDRSQPGRVTDIFSFNQIGNVNNDGTLDIWEMPEESNLHLFNISINYDIADTGEYGILEKWLYHGFIVLTPSEADVFLTNGVLSYSFNWETEDDRGTEEVEIEIPGLRELILAARGEIAQDNIGVIINGVAQTFEVAPQIIDGRTMLPLRAIGEALGMAVDFDSETNTASLTLNDLTITHAIGTTTITTNSITTDDFDVSSVIIEGRTLVPARMIAEAMGAAVDWDGEIRTVTITTN
ncbi:MAG: copper amine oxidase N-terminal domain-containing protein [Defluviitaleaceae bacterium]|nr:copper amine oxidase N-terminal domain-containing protein [Defluviitaleaceae bacterium]